MSLLKIFTICLLLSLGLSVFGQEEVPKAETDTASKSEVNSDKLTLQEYWDLKNGDAKTSRASPSVDKSNRRISWASYAQMIVVLFFVLFLIFLFFYMTKGKLRKTFVGNNGIEVICRASLMPKQTIMVVRVGTRLLILNGSSDGHVSTLSEITDRAEIAELLSEVNKASRDNLFDSLLKRNQVLYDEEMKNADKTLEKVDRDTDNLQEKLEKDKRV